MSKKKLGKPKKQLKLSDLDLNELRNRQQMISQHNLIANSLTNALQVWIGQKLKEYGVKDGIKCNISFENGNIDEIK